MFDRDDPRHLMDSLCKFLPIFHRLEPDGISEEKLAKSCLPYALRRVYAWAGSGYLGNPFSTQDALVPFELLRCGTEGEEYDVSARGGKTMFVYENQCVWTCAVDNDDDSDSFYLELGTESNPWTKMPFSLSHFLVSFMILESHFNAKFIGKPKDGKTVKDVLVSAGLRSIPLWNGRYVSSSGPTSPSMMYVADEMKLLIIGNEIATNSASCFDQIKDRLEVRQSSEGETLRPGSNSWDRISLEHRKWHFEYKAIQFQSKVDLYSAQVKEMERQMAEVQAKIDERDR